LNANECSGLPDFLGYNLSSVTIIPSFSNIYSFLHFTRSSDSKSFVR
jgi:hypothetical protein